MIALSAKDKIVAENYWNEYQEVTTLLSGIAETLQPHADGKASRLWLESAGLPNLSEWQASFFEHMIVSVFEACYQKNIHRKYQNMEFDYNGVMAWDIKTKVTNGNGKKPSSWVILNDLESTREAVAAAPLHYIVVTGEAEFDTDGSFHSWWRETHPTKMKRSTSFHRALKTSFTAKKIEVYTIFNTEHLDSLIDRGTIKEYAQGLNSDGNPRRLKYQMNLESSRQDSCVLEDSTLFFKIFEKDWVLK